MRSPKNIHSPLRQARMSAGLSPDEAAKKARVSKKYLLEIERSGNIPFHLMERLCAIYQCPKRVFFIS